MKFFISLVFYFICISVNADATLNGEKLVQKHCSECHQKDGNSMDEKIPKIAQFSAILTFDILDQFKSGDRESEEIQTKDGQVSNMVKVIKKLSSEEAEAIALFLANQSFKPSEQAFDKQLAEQGKQLHQDLCENCHVKNGSSPIEDTPILKGQWKPYLIKQFEAFNNGERYMPKRMKKRFRKLSGEDHKALIEFYISSK